MLGDKEVEWIIEYSIGEGPWTLYARTGDLIFADRYFDECEARRGLCSVGSVKGKVRLREVQYVIVKED